MIEKGAIVDRANEWGLRANIVEKDYVLGWLLAAVGSHPLTRDAWVLRSVSFIGRVTSAIPAPGRGWRAPEIRRCGATGRPLSVDDVQSAYPRALRSASPMVFTDSTVNSISSPGYSASHGYDVR